MRLCVALCLGFSQASLGLAAGDAVPPSVASLLSRLDSNHFSDRAAAQQELARRATHQPEDLAAAYIDASPEGRARLRQLLEGVFLSCADERGDRAEKILMTLEEFGSPTAQAMLQGNSRLRESRARVAIERLGGHLSYINPADTRVPSPLAPLVGVGFGEPAELKTILIPESWTGTIADLWQFERLAHHQDLVIYNIRGNKLTLEDLLPLTTKLVGLQIMIRGACLGIEAAAGSPRADIAAVVEKSAAAEAGLMPYDRIEKLNDTPVRNFSHLVELLTHFHPGDKVVLEVRRNNELQTIPVTLASWKTILHRELRTVPAPTPFPGPLGFGTPPPPESPVPVSEGRNFMMRENN